MEIQYFCPYWGSDSLSYKDFAKKVKDAGYDGAEIVLQGSKEEVKEVKKIILDHDLKLVGQHWMEMGSSIENNLKEYEKSLYTIAEAEPLFINAHTGKDHYTFEENVRFIDLAEKVSSETGITIVHETHRGRFTFAAHVTKNFLEKFPGLLINADFSHWCCVAETLLQDQEEAIDLAIERAYHIHARIGFEQGPQIPDPRAPEWESLINRYISWWSRIIKLNKDRGREFFTIAPEFGPVPYMTTMPLTSMPISSQWDINKYMMDLLRTHFNKG